MIESLPAFSALAIPDLAALSLIGTLEPVGDRHKGASVGSA
jgi:hypothetical protein